MNQTTVDSNKTKVEEYTSTATITFSATEKTIEVPPQDKAYGSFSTTYLEGMEIPAGNGEFDEKTGKIIESDGTTHTVSKEEMERYKADNSKKLIAKIKEATKKSQESKTRRPSEKSSKTKKSTSKVAEGRGE